MPNTESMSGHAIDAYLARQDEPQRRTLDVLRKTILEIVPEAEECISYGLPAFQIDGKVVAGFGAFKNHLSYLPHSGSVLSQLREDLSSYSWSSGALKFPVDAPLSKELVAKLIAIRLKQIKEAASPR